MIRINIFQAKEETEEEKASHPVEDAKEILESVNATVLKTAREAYLDIKKSDPAYDPDYEKAYNTALPTWRALEDVVKYGDFKSFPKEELTSLKALKRGYMLYYDIIHLLIDHHNDVEEAKKLFEEYPDLHAALPEEYDNPQHMIEVLLETVRDYQWQLEHFCTKYRRPIREAIAALEGKETELET